MGCRVTSNSGITTAHLDNTKSQQGWKRKTEQKDKDLNRREKEELHKEWIREWQEMVKKEKQQEMKMIDSQKW